MNPTSMAKIIGVEPDGERLCASAARISTTPGTALELFETGTDTEKNRKLIRGVVRSGHRSVIEHAVFHVAFNNVSVAVEEFLIEFRLASYTVKSRRYVDFGSMGYFVPQELTEHGKELYCAHIESLFADYNELVARGVPKEDARFVLPYAFFSNFYVTVNARELVHMITEMKYGRGKNDEELVALANQLSEQLTEFFPVAAEMVQPLNDATVPPIPTRLTVSEKPCEVVASASLLSYPPDGAEQIRQDAEMLYRLKAPISEMVTKYPRLEEQINLRYRIDHLSLSSVTHLVRHRVQSLLVPPLTSVDVRRYMIPETVAAVPELAERYRAAFARNAEVLPLLRAEGLAREVCLCMSGNTLSVVSVMNARELRLFFRLRTCTRAQWEIRAVARDMLSQARSVLPEVFSGMGPSCVVLDACPEGRMCCGQMAEMKKLFS